MVVSLFADIGKAQTRTHNPDDTRKPTSSRCNAADSHTVENSCSALPTDEACVDRTDPRGFAQIRLPMSHAVRDPGCRADF